MKSSVAMNVIILVLLMSNAAFGFEGKPDFFESVPVSRSQPQCCQDNHVLSCDQFKLNTSLLGTDDQLYLSPLNVTLDYIGLVGESDHTYHYGSSIHNVDFIVTHNVNTGGVYGHAVFMGAGEYRSFVIEYCGNFLHALKEVDVDNLEEDSNVDYEDHEEDSDPDPTVNSDRSQAHPQTRCWWMCPPKDTTTIVTYTVKVYYTPQFAAKTPDITGYVDQVIAETNQGYNNSKVPIQVKKYCIEGATIADTQDADELIENFAKMKGTMDALRDTADTAVLLAYDFDSCGVAWDVNTINSKKTIAVVKKDCALGYYSFGHELGHVIGLKHNREAMGGWFHWGDNYGYLIAQGSSNNNNGFRTIMAYKDKAAKHQNRVNYYSNPNVILPATGTPTGIDRRANSARTLSINRFAIAAVGDESGNCGCGRKDEFMTFELKRKFFSRNCERSCNNNPMCIAWNNYYGFSCYNLEAELRQAKDGRTVGPNYDNNDCVLPQRDYPCNMKNKAVETAGKYLTAYKSIADAEACHEECKKNKKCISWIFVRQSTGLTCALYGLYVDDYDNYFTTTSSVKGCT